MKFFFLLFLLTSLSVLADGNDLELTVNFSGLVDGVHESTDGIMSFTIQNNGPGTVANPSVGGGFISSLSATNASPFFMTIHENLNPECGYDIYFHVDPIMDWFYFLWVDFPKLSSNQSFTCEFRYRIIRPNLITTSYRTFEQDDPNPDNNLVQITLRGFVETVPTNNLILNFGLVFLILVASLRYLLHLKKIVNDQSSK